MVSDIFGHVIGSEDHGVVAGTDHLSRDRFEKTRADAGIVIDERPHWGVAVDVVDPVGLVLPIAPTVKAEVAALVMDHARSL